MSKIKNFFSTPKKAIITSVCILAGLAIIGTVTVFATEMVAESKSIGKTRAGIAALADAGIDYSEVSVLRTDFDRENGKYVYEVEFYANGAEYDYILDASSGAVIERDVDGLPAAGYVEKSSSAPVEKPSAHAQPKQSNQSAQSTQSAAPASVNSGIQSTQITLDEAKQAALSDAGLISADVTYTKGALDYDDGIQVYDIEFYTSSAEYDYEINASTGAIVDKNFETFNPARPEVPKTTSQQSVQGSYIGVDKAKSIALSHVGVSAGEVTFQKAKLENDDGRAEYEIEFYIGAKEYEYTIDATSGNILEYDSEYDD